jgi:spermidine/putrescine ABC transporter ATP-binding subunit
VVDIATGVDIIVNTVDSLVHGRNMTTAVETNPNAQVDSAAPPPAVELRGIGRRFGDTVAVERIDLSLAPGEFFALLGPSGCGKTTTLRMVGGFELPSSGTILLGGEDVTTLPPYRRNVNTVFQSYALFPHLSVFDNVAFGLRRKGLDRAETKRRVEKDLDMVGLGGYGKRKPGQLSGGQQQRVALARALVNEPKVLLLDEPMGALDAKIRKTMQAELKRIQQEVGITFLYVTHDQAEAMAMADRLAVMNAGLCEDIGTPDRVYDHPATQFVAEFLGTCNVLPITSNGQTLRLPDGSIAEVADAEAHGVLGRGSRVGIRPEKLVIGPVTDASGPNSLVGTVTLATYLGASTEYEVSTAWGSTVKVVAQNLGEASRARVGDTVRLSWDAGHCFILPPAETAAS